MSPSALALLGYAGLMLVLLVMLATMRSALVFSGRRQANDFSPTGEDISPFSRRLVRAHANCYENLPIFATIVLVALVTGHAAITDGLALWVLAARIAQSTVHLISTSPQAVTVRFGCYLVQVAIEIVWVCRLACV
jgi:uncharacterized MAPEG superfamily protein